MDVDPPETPAPLQPAREGEGSLVRPEEMPVVARMVIEVRSDGTRTLARGAIEDLLTDQTVAIELPAMTPGELSAQLGKTLANAMGSVPSLGRLALRSLVPDPVRKLKRKLFGSSSADAP